MILICPSCSMRYLVSEGAIGPKGRRVRCAHCGHQWTQEPETGLDEELFGEEPPAFLEQAPVADNFEIDVPPPSDGEADFQSILRKEIEATPIPQGVHPEPDDPVLNQLIKDKAEKKKAQSANGERFAGFTTAVCLWLIILGAFLVFHPQISRVWPPSNLIYDLVGLTPAMPGEGLALDGLHVELADGEIRMKGNILNLRNQDVTVPPIMATIVDDTGQTMDRMVIKPPIARIKPEGQAPFEAVYPDAPDDATDVAFAFSFIMKDGDTEKPAAMPGNAEAHDAAHAEPAVEGHATHAPKAH